MRAALSNRDATPHGVFRGTFEAGRASLASVGIHAKGSNLVPPALTIPVTVQLLVKNGTSGLQDALTKIKNDLQSVKSAAGSDLQPQVNALQTAVDQLSTALSNASSVGVAGVATAAKDVATAGSTLLTSLDKLKCG